MNRLNRLLGWLVSSVLATALVAVGLLQIPWIERCLYYPVNPFQTLALVVIGLFALLGVFGFLGLLFWVIWRPN